MDVPTFFLLLFLLGLLAVSAFGVIKAASQRRWGRAGCITTVVLVSFVVLSCLGLIQVVAVFFTLLVVGVAVFLWVGMMMAIYHKRWKLAAGLGLVIAAGSGYLISVSGPDWQDGDIKTYQMDDGLTRLGRQVSESGFMQLVGEDVVALGSDEKWIVAETREPVEGTTHFYLLRKEPRVSDAFDVEGPLTLEAFQKAVTERALPPFSWRR